MVCFELMDTSCVDILDETVNSGRMLDDSSEFEDLLIRQVAGGSITDFPPIFSQDEENILLVWNNTVRVFNVTTGEWVRDLEKTDADLVGIEFDPTNPKLLIGCTRSGEVVTWKWKSGIKHERINLMISSVNFCVKSFNVFEGQEGSLEAVVVYFYDKDSKIKLDVFRLTNGESLNAFPAKFNALKPRSFKVFMSNRQKIFALIQRHVVYVGNLATGKRRFHNNPYGAFFTTIAIHPTAPIIATGDLDGKVILWSDTDTFDPVRTVYHWHSAAVKCIAFTESGSHFFSGGAECVLLKWTLNRPEMRSFLPRMRGAAHHVSVGPKNQQIAVALSDNGIQLLDANMGLKALIQNFSHVADDLTGEMPFPAGLKINPRNNSIVLNGRTGHLQFFSPHTRSFLYDIDITGENQLTPEPMNIVYNTRVTKVAICLDWMATAECWNDHEHFPQTRLKFWAFSAEKQIFSLMTDIQMPHEKSITALEFSGIYTTEKVVCASAGGDNCVMTWNCESARKNPTWNRAGKISYRNYPIKSLAFSQDGSLLAAGFGHVCVVYTTDELIIKAIFSAPSGLDGGIGKVSVFSPAPEDVNGESTPAKKLKKRDERQRRRAIELIQAYLEQKNTEDLVKFIKDEALESRMTSCRRKRDQIDDKDVFQKIMTLKDLNLDQKLEILRQLEIFCRVNKPSKERLKEFLEKSETLSHDLDKIVENTASLLADKHKYAKKSYLWHLKRRRECYQRGKESKNAKLSQILFGSVQEKPVQNGNSGGEAAEEDGFGAFPLTEVAEIQTVTFSCAEFAHLLIVATKNRVLIWNLLTLKLQSVLRVSAVSVSVDRVSGLLAVFTRYNNLYVFLPNTPLPLYHRRDLPNIYDAVWIPRRDPRSTSLNIDWQANSQLFFLTEQQQLLQMVAQNDEDDLSPMVTFLSEANTVHNYTPFGAMIAKQMQQKAQHGGVALPTGILGKSDVNELINSIPHAMAPVRLLSKSFLKSLLITTTTTMKKKAESDEKFDKQSPVESASVPMGEEEARIEERVEKMKMREMRNSEKGRVSENEVSRDDKLNQIAKSCVQFEM
ncbi:WD repeat-containing protein 75 [Phlebotomus argentipes]|uniref:WD repeat-containing protein 75 n=1 Tax=Phlebotomus argentipes TaxID=94469 RepID=UPI002892B14F|nr:WD repeat-containing protein 75 [Phlebotomus argentipes]